jgi:hypothetical protein
MSGIITLIDGVAGCGKTTFACGLPGPRAILVTDPDGDRWVRDAFDQSEQTRNMEEARKILLRWADDKTLAQDIPQIVVERSEQAGLVIEDLCIAESSGRILIEHLNADIRRGEQCSSPGPGGDRGPAPGHRRTALGQRTVWLPADGEMFFIPADLFARGHAARSHQLPAPARDLCRPRHPACAGMRGPDAACPAPRRA